MPKKSRKKRTGSKKLRYLGFLILTLLILAPVSGLLPLSPEPVPVQEAAVQVAPPVVRFHVLANSDDPADQALKNRVRDEALRFLYPLLESCVSLEDTRSLLLREMERLKKRLEDFLTEGEKLQEVTLIFEDKEFPTRAYAGQVYPAGTYETFTVVLGNGQGENWWCVMFPPLCLTELALLPEGESSGPRPQEPGDVDFKPVEPPPSPAPTLRFKVFAWFHEILSK